MTTGQCLCGAVRYEVDGPIAAMMNCHCSMCRKHHGAAYATFAVAPLGGFRWRAGEDQQLTFQSSEHGVRKACRTCGSVGPMLIEKMGLAVLPAGNLGEDPGIRPQFHMFVASKAPWFELSDDLPKHDGYPPEWGGGMGVARPTVTKRPGIAEGSCLCGDVAFEVTGELVRAYHCHCTRCQRARSAAFASNFFWPADGFRWLRGEGQVASYKLPEARFFTTCFCERCGGAAPRINRERNMALVPGGALDVEPDGQPLGHIFVASKAPWETLTDSLPQYAEMPPS